MLKKIILLLTIALIHFDVCATTRLLQVVSTTTPIGSLAKMIGGVYVNVEVLQNCQGCPHHYQITPSNFEHLANADILFAVDEKFESYLPTIQKRFPNKQLFKISDLKNINIISSDKKTNWHLWLDLNNCKIILEEFTKLFSKLWPAHERYFLNNEAMAKTVIRGLAEKQKKLYSTLPEIFIWSDELRYLENNELLQRQFNNPNKTYYDFLDFAKTSIADSVCVWASNKDYKTQIKKSLPPHQKIVVLDGDNWEMSNMLLEELFAKKFLKLLNSISRGCTNN